MRVGVLGTGQVGKTLASGFARKGHEVLIGTRDPKGKELDGIALGTMQAAAQHGDIVVFAVNGMAGLQAIKAAGPGSLGGKLVLDTTNALNPGPHGLHLPDGMSRSLMESFQEASPTARFVKAWNCVPGIMMVDPDLPGGPGTQFVCGNDDEAKSVAQGILRDFGWGSVDIGDVTMARHIEAMALAVINHGMRSGEWAWGLKLLQK